MTEEKQMMRKCEGPSNAPWGPERRTGGIDKGQDSPGSYDPAYGPAET